MGGIFIKPLRSCVTHLISESVWSVKYEVNIIFYVFTSAKIPKNIGSLITDLKIIKIIKLGKFPFFKFNFLLRRNKELDHNCFDGGLDAVLIINTPPNYINIIFDLMTIAKVQIKIYSRITKNKIIIIKLNKFFDKFFFSEQKAIGLKIPVLTEGWVEAVWQASLRDYVKADDPQFNCYKCPVFMKLVVTSTNLSKRQKEEVKKLIDQHGGVSCKNSRELSFFFCNLKSRLTQDFY